MIRPYWILLKRDMLLIFRQSGDWINPLLFSILIVSLFPLAIGPERKVLQMIAPGIIWVTALLANLLSLDQLFRSDYDDGSLEQLLSSPQSIYLIVLVKVLSYWVATGVPMILIAPLLAVLLALPSEATLILMLTLLLGTPTLCFIGAIGAALTVGLKKGGALLSLIILPLNIPVLIFAASAVAATVSGFGAAGQLYYLAALLVLTLSLAPLAIAASLRMSVASGG